MAVVVDKVGLVAWAAEHKDPVLVVVAAVVVAAAAGLPQGCRKRSRR